MQLCLEMADETVVSLWVRIRRQNIMSDGVGVCFRPAGEEEVVMRPSSDNSSLTFADPGAHGRLEPA